MRIIDKVVKRLAGRFRFGYHEIDDIEQEARLIALKGMENYDRSRPLENFLGVHVKNRLCTFKRDNFLRPNGPCDKCDYYDHVCCKYEYPEECAAYEQWQAKNQAKLNLIYPIEFSCVDDHNEREMRNNVFADQHVISGELESILNLHVPIEHRHNYLRLRYGYRVPSQYKLPLLQLIREIIDEHYISKEKVENTND